MQVRYRPGTSLEQAVSEIVEGVLAPGDGGIIAVDKDYNISMEFNTPGMYRGAADSSGRFETAIF